MNLKIRESILKLDNFKPCSGIGYKVSAMMMYSEGLLEIPHNEIKHELDLMLTEGLIENEEGYYRSTKLGQIERVKFLSDNQYFQKPMANQRAHDVSDLILAILAHNYIKYGSHSHTTQKEAIYIFLHQIDEQTIDSSIDKLINLDLINKSDIHPKNSIYITGYGLQEYKLKTETKLQLERDVGILSASSNKYFDDRFDNIKIEENLANNLKMRWHEAELCANNCAYFAAVVLIGSVIEGILLSILFHNMRKAMTSNFAPKIKKTNEVKKIEDWSLKDYISVSVDLEIIPRSIQKHVDLLRDTRNLIHPNKQIKDNINIDEPLYRITREVADSIIDYLQN